MNGCEFRENWCIESPRVSYERNDTFHSVLHFLSDLDKIFLCLISEKYICVAASELNQRIIFIF